MPSAFKMMGLDDIDLDGRLFDPMSGRSELMGWLRSRPRDERAIVNVDDGLRAFLHMGVDEGGIVLRDGSMPRERRLRIVPLADDEDLMRAVLDIALSSWQRDTSIDQAYTTVPAEDSETLELLRSFGLCDVGPTVGGERVLVKDKRDLATDDGLSSFPYIDTNDVGFHYIPVYDCVHDELFTRSEVVDHMGDAMVVCDRPVRKVVAVTHGKVPHRVGDVALIYRVDTSTQDRRYRSAVTSYCTITGRCDVMRKGRCRVSFRSFMGMLGEYDALSESKLREIHRTKGDVVLFEVVVNGLLTERVTCKALMDAGLIDGDPYRFPLTLDDFEMVLELSSTGDVVPNRPDEHVPERADARA